MGILDEAIRDHLELKRQRGANREELQRLEDEAFGPPSRPGEPDFPSAEPAQATAEAAAFEAEPPTTLVGAEEAPPAPEPSTGADRTLNGGAEPSAPSAAEPAFEEHPVVEEHPVLSDEAASPATPYDHSVEDDLDIDDLDLTLEEPVDTAVSPAAPPAEEVLPGEEVPPAEEPAPAEEPRDAAAPAEAEPVTNPAAAPAPAPPEESHEPPIESLETVEHPFEPGLAEREDDSAELPLEPESDELDREPPEALHEEQGSGEDDVLADTPDFLRDAPEDDELWFEQGEPKDFDFD